MGLRIISWERMRKISNTHNLKSMRSELYLLCDLSRVYNFLHFQCTYCPQDTSLSLELLVIDLFVFSAKNDTLT